MYVRTVTDECKEFEKKAKAIEKDNPLEAIVLYKLAAKCFVKHDKTKNKNSNLVKIAKLLREEARSSDDPAVALGYYEQVSLIYREIDKAGEAEKIMHEASQKYIDAAKLVSSEGRQMDDIYAAENKFKIAAEYAMVGNDEQLSNKYWVESGNQFYSAAKEIVDPREALEVFKHAILNYNKGNAKEKEKLLLIDAAEKFDKKASKIYKTHKTLVLAIDNYLQASVIYHHINSQQKSLESDQKIEEICDEIGIVKESIINYLDSQGIKAVSLLESSFLSDQNDKQDMSFVNGSSKNLGEDGKTDETAIIEKEIPEQTLKLAFDDFKEESKIESISKIPTEEIGRSEIDQPAVSSPPVLTEDIQETFNPEVIKQEIPNGISQQESLDDLQNNDKMDFKSSDTNVVKKKDDLARISEPIVDMLRDQGYIKEDIETEKELLLVPEYQILLFMINNHPIPFEEIEAKTEVSSISLALSNLQADGLIGQTDDYLWTISQKVKDNIV